MITESKKREKARRLHLILFTNPVPITIYKRINNENKSVLYTYVSVYHRQSFIADMYFCAKRV